MQEGLLGMGTNGKRETEEWNLKTGANPEDQICRGPPPEQQNVEAVSIRHCAVTTTPRNCCPNCYAEQSHKDKSVLGWLKNLSVLHDENLAFEFGFLRHCKCVPCQTLHDVTAHWALHVHATFMDLGYVLRSLQSQTVSAEYLSSYLMYTCSPGG